MHWAIGMSDVSTGSSFEVQTLERQISDWRCCPTTDPKTKQEKVQKLQTRLNAIEADDKTKSEQAKQAKNGKARETGAGGVVNIDA